VPQVEISTLKRVLEIKVPLVRVMTNQEPCREILAQYRLLQRALKSSVWRKVADPSTIDIIDRGMEEVNLYLKQWTIVTSKGTRVAVTSRPGHCAAEEQAADLILRIKEALRDMK